MALIEAVTRKHEVTKIGCRSAGTEFSGKEKASTGSIEQLLPVQ